MTTKRSKRMTSEHLPDNVDDSVRLSEKPATLDDFFQSARISKRETVSLSDMKDVIAKGWARQE